MPIHPRYCHFAVFALAIFWWSHLCAAKPLVLEFNEQGALKISFQGILQQSSDLIEWADLDPQPTSPRLAPTTADASFYRSKGVAGNGLLQMPGVFTDFMVLQRGRPNPIWGHVAPGAEITVSFDGVTYSTLADENGRWEVELPIMDTNWTGRTMIIDTGWETKVIDEIVVGEVWFVSGGANMNLSLGSIGTVEAQSEIENTFDDMLRVFRQEETAARFPQNSSTGNWNPAVTGFLDPIAAVPYYFGKKLRAELGVPIGIIECARDAQPIESYLSEDALATFPQGQNELYAKFNAYAEWEAGSGVLDPNSRSELAAQTFNAMISPLAGYEVRGLLWYQGEVDATWNKSIFYREFLQALAGDLRAQFGAQLPFYTVQLANYIPPSSTGGSLTWTTTQDEIRRELPVMAPGGMVVANDIGDPFEMNPTTGKREIGERLAGWALLNEYGQTLVPSGPLYQSAAVVGSTIEIDFSYSSGLTTRDGQPVATLEIRNQGGHWLPATGVIANGKLIVSRAGMTNPIAVRYAWDANPTGANLVNGSGLLASLFITNE